MSSGWLIGSSATTTVHRVCPDLGVADDTLLPLLDVDLTALRHERDWPERAVVLGYHPYDYLAVDGQPWLEFRLDETGGLEHAMPRRYFFEDPLLRPGERAGVVSSFAAVEQVARPSVETWEQRVRFGPGYGLLLDHPLWFPSDMPVPSDPDGTPMTFVGQFAAGECSPLMPSFTYWLYWSPRRQVFAQLDEHD